MMITGSRLNVSELATLANVRDGDLLWVVVLVLARACCRCLLLVACSVASVACCLKRLSRSGTRAVTDGANGDGEQTGGLRLLGVGILLFYSTRQSTWTWRRVESGGRQTDRRGRRAANQTGFCFGVAG